MIEAFRPRPPWLGGHLQTIRNQIVRPRHALPEGERLWLDLGDGDALAATLHRVESQRPLVVLVHGLAGTEDSLYVQATASHLLTSGFPVLRLNLRGAGPSAERCRRQYHAGRSEDLRLAFAALPADLAVNGVALVGYSLGGNVLLKFLGEGAAPAVRAAASVSAPIDLAEAASALAEPRNRLYQTWLLAKMRSEALAGSISDQERRAVVSAKSVIAFDDGYVAPRNGFASAADYYARSSAAPFLARIAVPTLVIHATNDPWIPMTPYGRIDWQGATALTPLFAAGGHVGFHGAGSPVAWHDRAIVRFFIGRL
ncbi:MAG: alpha/beta fold hydrolase [Alphaproteobacteria bacterium]|nr:alpha/beta fold hydrolase [Alphaproteobacteria bacterium]